MNAISSTQNPRIKALLQLQQKSAERRRTGLFVVEGMRELQQALAAGYEPVELYICRELTGETADIQPYSQQCFEIPATLYAKIAYRDSTEGIVAVMRQHSHRLSDLQLPDDALVMVLESVEKPGNLGAILRSADAARADAVIVCDALTDLYNPNLIRASIGALFTVPVATCTSAECIAFLQARGIQILTAQLQDSQLYYDVDMARATAIVMGTESTGLTLQWRQAASAHIRIPMRGRMDSLNVSVSAAILLFEAVRQRMIER